jgi:hypothetical protein
LEPGRRVVTSTAFDLDRDIVRDHFAPGPHIVAGSLMLEMGCQSALLLLPSPGALAARFFLAHAEMWFMAPAEAPVTLEAETRPLTLSDSAAMFQSEFHAGDSLVARSKFIVTRRPISETVSE